MLPESGDGPDRTVYELTALSDGAVLLGTRLAARLLRSRLDASMAVENLRAP